MESPLSHHRNLKKQKGPKHVINYRSSIKRMPIYWIIHLVLLLYTLAPSTVWIDYSWVGKHRGSYSFQLWSLILILPLRPTKQEDSGSLMWRPGGLCNPFRERLLSENPFSMHLYIIVYDHSQIIESFLSVLSQLCHKFRCCVVCLVLQWLVPRLRLLIYSSAFLNPKYRHSNLSITYSIYLVIMTCHFTFLQKVFSIKGLSSFFFSSCLPITSQVKDFQGDWHNYTANWHCRLDVSRDN